MKKIDQFLLFLLSAAIFLYLVLCDYPAMKRNLAPSQDVKSESVSQEKNSDSEESESTEQEDEADAESIPATQTVLVTGSIQENVYTDVYPSLRDADHTGTLVFLNSHLTGDVGQMGTDDFLELLDAGWDYAVGGIGSDLSAEEWKSSLSEEVEDIRQRTGKSPSVYYFQSGEYQTEREEALVEEGFTALYYSVEDAENISTEDADIKRICTITISAESDLQEILDQAWSYESVALYLTSDSDDSSVSEEWSNVLSALDQDERFSVTGQADWIESTQEYDADRADKVSSILESEAE